MSASTASVVMEDDIHNESFIGTLVPFMFGFIILEFFLGLLKGQKWYRLDDTINSVSHGMLEQLLFSLTSKSAEFGVYIWLWNNRALWRLPADSTIVWILCFLGVDLAYYWFHRMAHEVNILWSTHQVHHSSEDMNLSTSLRQGVFQVYFSWIFYVPLAFFIPPQLFYAHKQFNTLYQFFIHTRAIKSLGPLEWILNCPSHHRVHHARNRIYIDKNYGGVLIIWDRMFGTYAQESEEPFFGLVHPLATWDIFHGQLCHLQYIFNRLREEKGMSNKLSVLFKGPGWNPGTPRLGNIEDIPEIDKTQARYGHDLTSYLSLYVSLHFVIIVVITFFLLTNRFHSSVLHLLVMSFVIFSLYTFSAICDRKPHAAAMEISRVLLFLVSELVCYLMYKDDFVFLWYRDDAADPLLPLIHRPVRLLRMAFVLSFLWITGRTMLFSSSYNYDSPVTSSSLTVLDTLRHQATQTASQTTTADTNNSKGKTLKKE